MIELVSNFEKIKGTDSFKVHNDFIKCLLSSGENDELYALHFQFIQNSNNDILHERLCRAFTKRDKNAASFLLHKALYENIDNNSLADIIQILGLMKCYEIIPYIPKFLLNEDETIRDKCIIILGWLGDKSELEILLNIINSKEVDYLRGLAITAIRQIGYNHPELKDEILYMLNNIIIIENSEWVISMIIITVQDLLTIKLGLKENYNGEISGNIERAKAKAISELSKYFG